MSNYRTYWDENGDETTELEDYSFKLPKNYREREIHYAFLNTVAGTARADLAVSRNTLHGAVQMLRACTYGFGDRFKKDPRRFSSTPRAR